MNDVVSVSRLPGDKYLNQILHYLVCRECACTRRRTDSMVDKSAIQVGLTPWGIQVWCTVHKINIASIDFGGRRLPAVFNANCRATPDDMLEAA